MELEIIQTPIGRLNVFFTLDKIYKISLASKDEKILFQFDEFNPSVTCVYLSADIDSFMTDLMEFTQGEYEKLSHYKPHIKGLNFSADTLKVIAKIPFGGTISYKQVAFTSGHKNASRAVGTICRKNPLPFIIPCHRVVNSDNKVGNYAFGSQLKRQILQYESDSKNKVA